MTTYIRFKNLGFLIFMLLVITNTLVAQENEKVDSMVQRLEVVTGNEKFEVLKDLFTYYYDNDLNKAIRIADEAFRYAVALGDSMRMIRAGRMHGSALDRSGHVIKAIEIYQNVLAIAQRNQFEDISNYLYNNLGNAYTNSGQYDKALECHLITLAIREKKANKKEVSVTLQNIGVIYHRLNNFEKAIEYYNRSRIIKEEINDSWDLDDLLINIGYIYSQLNNFDSAIINTRLGLQLCANDCRDKTLISAKNSLAIAYLGLKRYKNAEQNYYESLTIAEKYGDKHFQSVNLLGLANLNFIRGDTLNALKFLNKAELLWRGTGYNAIAISIFAQFSDYYYHLKDFSKAAHYQHQYIQLKDSLMGTEFAQNLAAVQSEYEQRAHQAAIAQKDALLQQERYLVYAVGFIALLIIIVIVILIRIYLLKLNHVQQKKLGLVETQATERERENLAKELHDGVGTDLIAVKLRVLGLLNQSKINPSTTQEIEDQFQSITKTVKHISYGLTPPGLDRYGLFSALSNYFNKLNESAGVAIHFNNSGADHNKGPVTIAIFRVLQELISNSLKHAFAKNIRITIESFDDLINILFEDDGKGFSPAAVKRGLGLYNVESRVQSLGGTIELESGPIGTFYSIDIPLTKPM